MMTEHKIFKNPFQYVPSGHGFTFCGEIWWKSHQLLGSCRKVVWFWWHMKNSSSARVIQAPDFAQILHPKFPERCHPSTSPRVLNLVSTGCGLPKLFPKDWFFGPHAISDYNIGWKPSIKIRITKVSTVHNKRLNLAYILLTYAYTKSIFLIDILKVYKLVANAVAVGSLFQSDTTRTGNEWARALILASGYNNFSGDPRVLLQLAN